MNVERRRGFGDVEVVSGEHAKRRDKVRIEVRRPVGHDAPRGGASVLDQIVQETDVAECHDRAGGCVAQGTGRLNVAVCCIGECGEW